MREASRGTHRPFAAKQRGFNQRRSKLCLLVAVAQRAETPAAPRPHAPVLCERYVVKGTARSDGDSGRAKALGSERRWLQAGSEIAVSKLRFVSIAPAPAVAVCCDGESVLVAARSQHHGQPAHQLPGNPPRGKLPLAIAVAELALCAAAPREERPGVGHSGCVEPPGRNHAQRRAKHLRARDAHGNKTVRPSAACAVPELALVPRAPAKQGAVVVRLQVRVRTRMRPRRA